MRTSSCRYAQVDVSTSKAGMGNPLGVVFDADGWSSARMQRLAAWLNLVEKTFVLAPSRNDASYRLRIITPSREIPFAGHPSIGGAYAALRLGFCTATGGELRQECAAGLLPSRVEGDPRQPLLSIASPPARIEADADPGPALALLAGLPPSARPPALVSGGRRWWIAEVGDEAALRAWTPPVAHIRRLAEATDSRGLCLFARSASPRLTDRGARLPLCDRDRRRPGLGRCQRPARRLPTAMRTAKPAGARLHRQPRPRTRT